MDPTDQQALSVALAAAHDDWLQRYRDVPPRDPDRAAEDGDYADHHLDLEATPEMEAEYQRLIEARGWRRASQDGHQEWERVDRGDR